MLSPYAESAQTRWRALWEAARHYSEAEAYDGEDFPNVDVAAKCVLCQQDLDPAARSRLTRFEEFVQDHTEQQARGAEQDLEDAVKRVRSIDTLPENVIAAIEELRLDDRALAIQARAIIGKFEQVVNQIAEHEPDASFENIVTEETESALQTAAKSLRTRASQADAEDFKRKLDQIKTERVELEDRLAMSKGHRAMLEEVSRLKYRVRLDRSKGETNTAPITRKAVELTRDHVTSRIRDQFTKESNELFLRRLTLKDTGGRKGQLTNQPAFQGLAQDYSTQIVLSEGEQTALGLAGFFTETAFDESRSAIVLDDPVSSLDHIRRSKVATRLAKIAMERQVVVFTHDLAFVASLRLAAQVATARFTERAIERRPDGTLGICRQNHPWNAQSAKKRLSQLKQSLVAIRKDHQSWTQEQYAKETSHWAGQLSEALERAIGVEIAGTVFDPSTLEVHPKMFRVFGRITVDDNAEFQAMYSRVSAWATRHDDSIYVNDIAPDLQDLEVLLDQVESWLKRMSAYTQSR